MTKPVYDSEISRRTLAKGAAWTVPAVAVAAFAPAAAASPNAVATGVTFSRAKGCVTTVTWTGKAGFSYQVQYRVEGSSDWSSATSVGPLTGTTGTHIFTNTTGAIVQVRVSLVTAKPAHSYPVPSAVMSAKPVITSATLTTITANFRWGYDVQWTPVEGATYTVKGLRVVGLIKTWETVPGGSNLSANSWSRELSRYYEKVQVIATICGKKYESNKWIFGSTQPSSPEPSPAKPASSEEEISESSATSKPAKATDEVPVKPSSTEKPSSNKKPASKPEAPVVESTPKPEPAPTATEAAVETP